MNKKDIRNIIIIILLFLSFVLYNFISSNAYISKVDFISQHFRIAQYFRLLFYSTFDLFPTFAFNLGAGQNIYYLSYHGLYSPITLLSYLFPFIKMSTFIISTNIILVILSTIFFYKFLITKFDRKITSTTTLLFTFAGPLIYHTHRHIMFNNYMLFLILALIGVDSYFNKGKKNLLIISILLIILSSYFFSIPAIMTICIYALHKYLSTIKKVNMKDLLKELVKFVLTVFVSIFMSAILLVPTVYTLFSGREETLNNTNILELLIPKFDINSFLYQPYSVGLSAILIFAVIDNLLNKKKEYKTLSVVSILLLIFPIFCYALNGFMYVDGKCFIPLLPLFCYMIAISLNNITKKDYNYKLLIISSIIVLGLTIVSNLDYDYIILFSIDYIVLIIAILLYKWKHKLWIITTPLILCSLGVFVVMNYNDNYISQDEFKNINTINENTNIEYDISYRSANLFYILENVNNVINNKYLTTSIYSSTSNMYYTNFVRNIMENEIYNKDYHTLTQSSNVLFNMYMGNMFLISNKDILGYSKISNNVYKNDNVYSIGYTNNELMSKSDFDKLDYPYNIDALMRYTIVNDNVSSNYDNSDVINYDGNIEIIDSNIDYKIDNNKYVFDVENTSNIKLKLDEDVDNKIIILTFDMDYNDKIDTSITINDVKNTLSFKDWKYHNNNYTFNYVLDSNILDVSISRGHYEISNINIYILDYNNYKDISDNHDKFIIDSIDNSIKGSINVTKDNSYFNLSIPYDLGFKIKVDNKLIDYELINTSFIGFKLDEGYHTIEISYMPPLYKLGIAISIIGVIIYLSMLWKGSKRNEKN